MLNTAHFKSGDLEIVKRLQTGCLPSPGSFVRLNSGGPVGIVTALEHDDSVSVSWLGCWPIEHSVLPDRCVSLVCTS